MLKSLFVLFSLIGSASAATTGLLQLQGVVPALLAISVDPQPIATLLDLTATQTDLLVASVNEQSNSNTGYQITVSSLNDGNLKRSGGSETLTYTMKYGVTLLNLNGSSVTPVVGKTQAVSGVYDVDTDITISYTGQPAVSMVNGTYQDTITFEISAN
jgi:hypothetical protein